MINLEKGLPLLIDVVTNKKTHKDYKRVVKLYDLYYKLITGDKIETLLNKFVRRENDDMFNQRVALTQAITPCVSSMIMATFNKVNRVKPAIAKFDWEESVTDYEDRQRDIRLSMNKYYAGESLENFMEVRVKDNSFLDPNSFIVTEFLPFDDSSTKADPYPFEVTCKEAIDYSYVNGELQYLIVKNEIEYKNGDRKEKGAKYTAYLGDQTIVWTQVDNSDSAVLEKQIPEIESGAYYRVDSQRLFLQEVFYPNAGRVPAIRIGYLPDLQTNGRTCVNPFHCALPYFMKTIKAVSEQDLTHSLHVFPRLLEYRQYCRIQDVTGICSSSGEKYSECSKCGGTGYKTQTSAQDAMIMKMPNDPKDLIDITKLSQYTYVPVEIVKYQDDYVNALKVDIYRTLFNSELTTKSEVATTAFEKNIEVQNYYDTLYPFAKQMSRIWMHSVTLIATYRDYGAGLIVTHSYNKDFKFKSIQVLMEDRKAAKDSGLPNSLMMSIDSDIAAQMYQDDPDELVKYDVKNRFNPFAGKTEDQISTLLTSDTLCTRRDQVLYANFDAVFEELENELQQENEDVWFYDLNYAEQLILINNKVAELIQVIDSQNRVAISFPPAGDQTDLGD